MSLLRIKIELEMEIVGEDIYDSTNLGQAAEEIVCANRREIISEAVEHGHFKLTATQIDGVNDLPPSYTLGTLPWLRVVFGDKTQDRTIKEI
jgi:hypothetical protein